MTEPTQPSTRPPSPTSMPPRRPGPSTVAPRPDAGRATPTEKGTPSGLSEVPIDTLIPFLNPYTFVPAVSRDRFPQELRDSQPRGHDRIRPDTDRWTGRIGVTIEVKTPLLLLDTAAATPEHNRHFSYPVLLRGDGKPHLPATAVKGMLRAAFEAITNSRFGVADIHTEPLGYRREAAFARDLVPARISDDGTHLELLQAARLPAYGSQTPVTYGDGTRPHHGDPVQAVIERSPPKGPWHVVKLDRAGPAPLAASRSQRLVHGWAFVTNQNASGKEYERVFYRAGQEKFTIDEQWTIGWRKLIAAYREAHSREEIHRREHENGETAKPWEFICDEPGRLAWSPHLYSDELLKLGPTSLCYARRHKGEGPILGLYPVCVPRDIFEVAPATLLCDTRLEPAVSIRELSPADSLFGWVAPNSQKALPSAYRGRLRIGPVTCNMDETKAVKRFPDGLPLAVLAAPKPQYGRFYLAERADEPQTPVPNKIDKQDLYRLGRALRGRKVYWHHAGTEDTGYWSDPGNASDPTQEVVAKTEALPGGRFREFLRPRESSTPTGQLNADHTAYQTTDKKQRDSQNRSVQGWVKPTTVFSFQIEVRDVSKTELGALVWLLSLPVDCFHRLGLGKPLGFGSVRVEVDHKTTAIWSGADWRARYRSLQDTPPKADSIGILNAARQHFNQLMAGNSELSAVGAAFLAAARGNQYLPVHYPRASPPDFVDNAAVPPDPRGRSFEWFTTNEQPKAGQRSLPSATEDAQKPTGSTKHLRILRPHGKI